METLRYTVKCDDCKTDMRRTDSLHESACGGRCGDCRAALARSLATLTRLGRGIFMVRAGDGVHVGMMGGRKGEWHATSDHTRQTAGPFATKDDAVDALLAIHAEHA